MKPRMQNKIQINKWDNFVFDTNYDLITANQIKQSVSSFNDSVNTTIPSSELDNHMVNVLFKIQTDKNQFRTISYLQTLPLKEIHKLDKIFIEYWQLRQEDYLEYKVLNILFTYKIVPNNTTSKNKTKGVTMNRKIVPAHDYKASGIVTSKFNGFNLPLNMDFTTWGNVHWIDSKNVIVYKKSSKLEYRIKLFNNKHEVTLMLDDNILLEFTDYMRFALPKAICRLDILPDRNDQNNLSNLTRKLKEQTYIIKDGEIILKKLIKKASFLKKIKKCLFPSKKFITMDLETRTIDNDMNAYCVSLYDGETNKSFYLTDYLNIEQMLSESIKFLMKRKYHNHKVYLHNFSNFDAVFLLKTLSNLSDKINPVIRDGNFINLRFTFADKYSLYFRDSLLLLPASLRKLAKQFNVENKGLFPYKFVNNKNIPLDYEGSVPSIKYFDNLTEDEFKEYIKQFKKNHWNLREETIKYCELDCLVLYKIISKFSDSIYEMFNLDILKYPTLSSLAFAIFRSNFLKINNLPLIHKEAYTFIKESYTGGSVDVFKPRASDNVKLRRYDVNSLYPFVMKNYPMPVGTPIYFEGDITLFENNPFGIFEVEVNCPENIKIPLLQTRLKTKSGFRTITPVGTWTGKYFSDELYNAAKFGYTYKVLRGYLFEKADIFSNYVDSLYKLKKNSSHDSPNYTISKLLLNSLYGRMGMNPTSENYLIETYERSDKICFSEDIKITNVIDLKNGKVLLSYLNENLNSDNDINYNKNVSVVVASIVTASARIYMSQFKITNEYNLYYSDTDSIDIDSELDNKFVGNDLGQMKLEHIFDDAIFLAPKLYGGISQEYEYVKVKGLKNPVKFNELIPLLTKNNKLEISQDKWYRDISNGMFHIKDEIYTLMVNESKRKLIYNQDNLFIDTLPIKLKDGVIVE